MSNPAGTYFQRGELFHRTPYQNGSIIASVDPVLRHVIYRQTMRVRAAYWKPIAWSSKGPNGSYLVEETEPNAIGTGLVEWQRIFWTKPPTRVDPETIAHPYQYRQGFNFGEVPFTVKARVTYSYFHTLKPEDDIPIARAFRYFKIGESLAWIGEPPAIDATSWLAQDETYKRLKANIYEKRSVSVPAIARTILDP